MSGQHGHHGLSGPIKRRKKMRERLRELEEAIGLREPSDDSMPPVPGSPEELPAPTEDGGSRLLPYAIGGGLLLVAIIALVVVRRRRARMATPNRRRRRRR